MMIYQKIDDMPIETFDWHIVNPSFLPNDYAELANQINAIVTKDVISRRILNKFSEYRFYISEKEIESENDIPVSFYQYFSDYVKTNSFNTVQIYKAYNTAYNPAENYDMTEESYNGIKKDKTTNTNTSNYGDSTNTSYKTTDNNVEKLTDKNIREHYTDTDTNETSFDNTQNVNYNGANTENYNEITKNEIRRHGNIGVMSVPDMIKKENDIRFMNAIYAVIDNICNDLLVLVETGD